MATEKQNRWFLVLLIRLCQTFGKGGWPVTASILFLASFTLVCLYLWQAYGDQILGQQKFRLKKEDLIVTPPPEWIKKTDIVQNAMVRGRLQGASILEVELGPKIKNAFLTSPWVREVELVNKSSAIASGINVRLKYRKPLAMVKVNAVPYEVEFEKGLFPVDVEGYLLPIDEFRETANDYPKIDNVDSYPMGAPGQIWGDPRVVEAARIIDLLNDVWKPLQFYQVNVPAAPSQQSNQGDYVLADLRGHRWVWGSPIGKERPDEASAGAKLARLKDQKFVSKASQLEWVDLTSIRQAQTRLQILGGPE